jgi:hypothetical protein
MGSFELSEGAVARLEAELCKDAKRRQADRVVRQILSAEDLGTEAQALAPPRPPPRISNLLDDKAPSATRSTVEEYVAEPRSARVNADLAPSKRRSVREPQHWAGERIHPPSSAPGRRSQKLRGLAFCSAAVLAAAVIGYQMSVERLMPISTKSDAAVSQPDPAINSPASSGETTISTSDSGQTPGRTSEGSTAPRMPDFSEATFGSTSLAATELSARTTSRDLDSDTIRLLMGRGQQLIASGDLASARLLFRRAAEAGDAAAAMAMGWTYDPAMVAKFSIYGVTPDVEEARVWYEKARELGSTEAPNRLNLLAKQ